MDIRESEGRNSADTRIKRRRLLWIGALALVGIIALVALTTDKVRELAERIITEYKPVPDVYDIKGYAAASEKAFARFLREGNNRETYAELKNFLQSNQVDQVVPPFELLRQGSDWREVGEPPFAIPPKENWKAMVDTLRVVQQEIVPRIGPVHVLSGWRTYGYNGKAGGSRRSKHMHFCGLDMVPQKKFSRKQLVPILRDIHKRVGKQWNMGLGIYSGVRFHVDTCGYRRW